MIPDRTRSHLVPYNTTALERDVAVALGIPMYGADPRHFPLGTKSGCRRLFAEEGVNHPLGYEDLHTIDDVVDSLLRMRAARPTVTRGLVKLNEGVSGAGNALVDMQDVPPPGSPDERPELRKRVERMAFESPDVPYDTYVAKLEERGGIVEGSSLGSSCAAPAFSCG